MDEQRPRRFRFGMLALLILVALCAIATSVGMYFTAEWLPPYEVRKLYLGMTPDECTATLGPPTKVTNSTYGEHWRYDFAWGHTQLTFQGVFPGDRKCNFIAYQMGGVTRTMSKLPNP